MQTATKAAQEQRKNQHKFDNDPIVKNMKRNNGVVNKVTNAVTNVTNKVKSLFDHDSENTDLQAIFDHKNRYNVKDPYVVIDKNNGTLSVYKGNDLLEQHYVTLGSKKGDGMFPLDVKYLGNTP